MATILERPLSREERTMHEFLARAVEDFQANPQSPRLIRHLAAGRPELFFVSAVRLLRDAPPGQGRRHLAALLLRDPDIVSRVTNRNDFTRTDTALVLQRMMEVEPLIDVRLAHELPDRYGQQRVLDTKASAQILDVLDQISPGTRLIHLVGYLADHPDPDIAAKATLLVARRIQSPDWIRRHIVVGDARIRANTVEGLWGSKQQYALTTYEECMHDQNNRVVGNALFGLHLVGEERVRPQIVDMARDQRPQFRSTAAWVMGQAGDPEFADPLHKLVRDDMPAVRKAALKSLIAIRRITHPKQELPAEEAAAKPADSSGGGGWLNRGLRMDGSAYRSQPGETN